MKKRLLAILVVLAMVFTLAACTEDPVVETPVVETPEVDTSDVEDNGEDAYVLDPNFEDSVFVDFGVMAFNHRNFTIPYGETINIGGNMGPTEGGEGGGASDAIRLIGFQGYTEPKDEDGEPAGFNDGLDSTWQILISQNGEFWENIARIEASFYLEGEGEAEDIVNVEPFYQGGGLWNANWRNTGNNLLRAFDEDNGGDGFRWGLEMTVVWDIPWFINDSVVEKGLDRELFSSPPVLTDPENENSDKKGGGLLKFGLQLKNENPLAEDISARIVWTDVKIFVYDLDLFMQHVNFVTEETDGAVTMAPEAIGRVFEVEAEE